MNALDYPCPVCRARKGKPCTNTIRPGEPLPGRDTHLGRVESGAK